MDEKTRNLMPFRLIVGNQNKRFVATLNKVIGTEFDGMMTLYEITVCFICKSKDASQMSKTDYQYFCEDLDFKVVGVDQNYVYCIKYIHEIEMLHVFAENMGIRNPILNYVGQDGNFYPLYQLFENKKIDPANVTLCEFQAKVPHIFNGDYATNINSSSYYWNLPLIQ